jgi:hypothetical protein
MSKRNRSSSVEIKVVDNENIIIEWNQKEYYVHGGNRYTNLFNDSELECEVIYGDNKKPLLNIENIRSGETIVCQEINFMKLV